ncbi:LacI family DNA-binding transcriptional regulator [Micromonospora sp. URMC 103]|uniref:LacI family DNA-binding transcriptional regulator n=1 Tax=Micromonospora sp. URMC 103 TaxID=3423406 RepID=UPI003F1D9A36
MAATLRDVARLAGVSVKTVSNVVNGYAHVSDGVRRRVLEAVEQIDYRPNLAARHLRTGRTGLLALVLSGVPCADELAHAVIRVAADRGYRVVVEQVGSDRRPGAPPRGVPADGILLGADVVPRDLVEAQVAAGTPLVLLGEGRDERCDRVALDTARAARDATDHLLRTGRRRIAAIGANPRESPAAPRPRTAGYREALRRAGVTVPRAYLRATPHHHRRDGYQAARSLLAQKRPPDAIFCYSDPLAIGAIRAAADVGLRVPDDVAVIGLGGSEEGRYSRPSLSTVSVDVDAIARTALTRIVTRITCPEVAPVEVTAPHTLLARESAPLG